MIGYRYDGQDVLAELNGSTVTATYLRSLTIDEPFLRQGGMVSESSHVDAFGSPSRRSIPLEPEWPL